MFSGLHGMRAALFVSALALVATACGAATTPSKSTAPTVVHAGDCFAKEVPGLGDVGPDFSSAVACTKPHIYEVAHVITIPAKFLRGTTKKAMLANRKVLGSIDADNKLAADLWDLAADECSESVFRLAGVKHITINGRSLKDVGAELAMGGAMQWFNLSSAKAWASGKREGICTVRYTHHFSDAGDVGPEPIKAASDHPAFYDFLTPDFPAIRRQCVTYGTDDEYAREPCTKHHYGEMFFSFDAAKAFGEKFVEDFDVNDPSDADFEKLSSPCYDALPELIGSDLDEDLSAEVDLGDGWYEDEPDYTTYCMGIPYNADKFDLPAGSLVENPSKVKFVKIAPGQGA